QPINAVLFSGQDAFGSLFESAATLSVSTLALLLVFKGLAWSVSLGNFRGGPTFPALFLGAAAGLLASHLPGFAETQAVASLMGAAGVGCLRLPVTSTVVPFLLPSKAGIAFAPLIIVAVVVAYIVTEVLPARRADDAGSASSVSGDAAPAAAGTVQSQDRNRRPA